MPGTIPISTMLIVSGGIILQSIITIYHIYTTNKEHVNKFRCQNIQKNPSLYGSFMLVFMGFINLFSLLGINIAQIWPATAYQCFINILIGVAAAIIFKVVLYSVLILRLYESYNNTMMGYNPKILIFWIIILTIWSAFNIFLNTAFTKTFVTDEKCVYEFYGLFMLSLAAMHLTGCGVNTYLFLKSAITLNKHIKKNNNASNQDLKSIAVRQCILNAGAVSITLFAIVLTALVSYPEIWTTFDMVISSFCVILLYKDNSNFVESVCSKCCCGLTLHAVSSDTVTSSDTRTTNTVTDLVNINIKATDRRSITNKQTTNSVKTHDTAIELEHITGTDKRNTSESQTIGTKTVNHLNSVPKLDKSITPLHTSNTFGGMNAY